MSFFLNRRVWFFLLLDAVILLGLVGIFAVVHHSYAASHPALSEDILITPTVSAAPSTVQSPTTVTAPLAYFEATESDIIDLHKLLCKNVKVDVHQVALGENYWTLAKKNNIDIYTLIGANPDMPFKAAYRQTLDLLSRKGVLHTVEKDDDLSKIALEYRTNEKVIQQENGLHWWRGMHAGDVLFIPDVRPIRMVKEWKDYFNKRGMFGVPFSKWATWTSGFGLRVDPFTGEEKSHKGIDLRAKYGDAVYASAPGKVIFTGVAGGYGNLIQIRHSGGYITFYGHLSKIYAKMGQKVRRGALIGRVGATGRVTGPHLHFEIRKDGKAVDPLQYI